LNERKNFVNLICLIIRERTIISIIKALKGRLIPIIKVRKAWIVVRDRISVVYIVLRHIRLLH
jgi:hypothetical protein